MKVSITSILLEKEENNIQVLSTNVLAPEDYDNIRGDYEKVGIDPNQIKFQEIDKFDINGTGEKVILVPRNFIGSEALMDSLKPVTLYQSSVVHQNNTMYYYFSDSELVKKAMDARGLLNTQVIQCGNYVPVTETTLKRELLNNIVIDSEILGDFNLPEKWVKHFFTHGKSGAIVHLIEDMIKDIDGYVYVKEEK